MLSYRMKNDMPISNPLLAQIKAEYPSVYEDCKKAANVIFESTGLMPNDSEIGFLCMHFGAAKEKIDNLPYQLRIDSGFRGYCRMGLFCRRE